MEPGKGNCETCKRLVRLLSGLDFFPADPEVRLLLVERLHRSATDHEHAKDMIDRWLDTNTAAAKVADLVRLAGEMRKGQVLPAGCDQCNGEPWVIGPNGAGRCQCARGQELRRRDRSHEPPQAVQRESYGCQR
jgi:hypothetical protein